MSATSVSYNMVFNKVQHNLPISIDQEDTKAFKNCLDFKIGDSTKFYIEAASRDYLLRKICDGSNADLKKVKTLCQICIEGTRQDLCLPTLPVLILSDAFDCITINQCEDLFGFVEENVAVWKSELFFQSCKNQFLRMCNDVLRKLSRSQNTDFCGRILLFLARFFPFSERSGLNLISEFNLENVTSFTDAEAMDVDADAKSAEYKTSKLVLNYTLYTKFWALQDFFRSPNQCFQKANWKVFTSYSKDIFEAFSSFKLDDIQSGKSRHTTKIITNERTTEMLSAQYVPKYLTNQKLLDLQFSDSNFRRYVLLQMLILTHYLTSKIKFRQESLTDEQLEWVNKIQPKAYALLAETPPNGKFFVETVKKVLKKEDFWSDWKNNGCQEIKKPADKRPAQDDAKSTPSKKVKRKLGDQIREADQKNKFIMGNAEMTRLWNICPNNTDACKSSGRDFVPTIESYFNNALQQYIDQGDNKTPTNLLGQSEFGWRAIRLLSQKSPHFFNSPNIITTVPQYLFTVVERLHKDLQAQKPDDLRTDEEEDVDKMVLDQNETDKVDEDDEPEEDEPLREQVVPLTPAQISNLALHLDKQGGDAWKKLAKKLDFGEDELEYFLSEGKTRLEGISIMLERWVDNEKEEANKSCIIYILEGLKMNDVAKQAFS